MSTIKAFVPQSQATNEGWYIQYVPVCQVLYLKPVLFPDYFEDFLARFTIGVFPTVGGLTQEETRIYQVFIQPMLCWYVAAEAMPTIWAHVGSKSISVAKEDNSEAVSYQDMCLMQNNFYNKGEVYAQNLRDYLNKYHDLFPPYDAEGFVDPASLRSRYASPFLLYPTNDPRFRGSK